MAKLSDRVVGSPQSDVFVKREGDTMTGDLVMDPTADVYSDGFYGGRYFTDVSVFGSNYIEYRAGDNRHIEWAQFSGVKLFYNNFPALETVSTGVDIYGGLDVTGGASANSFALDDNKLLTFGGGSDVSMFHTGSAMYMDMENTNTTFFAIRDGTSNLFELTRSNGNLGLTGNINAINSDTISPTLQMRGSGSGFRMYASATITYLQSLDATGVIAQNVLTSVRDGATNFYYNSAIKLTTTASGVAVTGTASATTLVADTVNTADTILGPNYINNAAGTKNHITWLDAGAVNLYYDGANKLQTSATGVNVSGVLTQDGVALSAVYETKNTPPSAGNWWSGGYSRVNGDGTHEIGRYLDFHSTSATTADNTYRMENTADDQMTFGGDLTLVGKITIGTGSRWESGTGAPEGVVTAPTGSMWTRTDGGVGSTLYVKEAGSGNTGWAAK